MRLSFLFGFVAAVVSLVLIAQSEVRADEPVKPIRALLVTGGCCHDYAKQKVILSEGVSDRANVEWDIVQQGGSATNSKIPLYENPDWAKGFDVVVHNECFAEIKEPEWTQRVLKPHQAGLPALVIHCSMHCYRDGTDEWFKFLGVTSHGHGSHYAFDVVPVEANKSHPILKNFGNKWRTPNGELYLITKLWDTATPLAQAMSTQTKKMETCVWTNEYGEKKTRVFGTTIGHYNEEFEDPVFLDYVTRGLLWSVGKLDDPRYSKPLKRVAKKVLVPVNLAKGKPATASASQDGHPPEHAVDGKSDSRWCSPNGEPGQWWQVDLEQPQDLTGCEITWEIDNTHYRYKVEGSTDAKTWTMLSDQRKGELAEQTQTLKFDAPGTRFVRVSITGLEAGKWGSVFEFEAHGKQMIEKTISPGTGLMKASKDATLSGVKVPAGWKAMLFAAPPNVTYPTCLAAAPTGEMFVGVDENGSIDSKLGRGRIVRCIDTDNDGKADQFTTFAKIDSPRGLFVDLKPHQTRLGGNGPLHNDDKEGPKEGNRQQGDVVQKPDNHRGKLGGVVVPVSVYCLAPPNLSVFHDDDGDGVSDRSEVLVEGIGFDLKFRGADHTTNGIQMGIDGWIYIAVGDYGFIKAVGTDKKEVQLRGGGIARVRPDGTELEIVSRGQRNIYDVAVSPYLDLFTRDNTNDGGGWNVRLSHVIPGAQMGYPSLFVNFPDEIVQPLADYGGGSPCGSLFVDEGLHNEPFGHSLYTCDWGRSVVYRHPLTQKGASFEADQQPFVEVPRPTDMDIDGSGRFYISTWKDGGFTFSRPDVGYVVQVTDPSVEATPFPDLAAANDEQLVEHLASRSHVLRLHAQRELLRRFPVGHVSNVPEKLKHVENVLHKLEHLAASDTPQPARVAALFTLKQLLGDKAVEPLIRLSKLPELREFALKALAECFPVGRFSKPSEPSTSKDSKPSGRDSAHGLENRATDVLVAALDDSMSRVRLQAVIGLGRIGKKDTSGKLVARLFDTDPLVVHATVKALVDLRASAAVLAAIDPTKPELAARGGLVLQAMHEKTVVDGVIAKLGQVKDSGETPELRGKADEQRRPFLTTLSRLHAREADWDGKWWTTRPDTSGPYYKPETWSESDRIAAVLRTELLKTNKTEQRWLLTELRRHKVTLPEAAELILHLAADDAALRPAALDVIASRPADAVTLPLLRSVAEASKEPLPLRAKAVRLLQRVGSPEATDIAFRVHAEWADDNSSNDVIAVRDEFLKDNRHAERVASLIKLAVDPAPAASGTVPTSPAGKRRDAVEVVSELAFATLLHLSQNNGVSKEARELAAKTVEAAWQNEAATIRLLRAVGLARFDTYELQVRAHLTDKREAVKQAATFVADQLGLDKNPDPNRVVIGKLPFEQVVADAVKAKGDANLGRKLFLKQGCVACHTVSKDEPLKGPLLQDITKRYKREELVESILKPSVKIAQGFESQYFVLDSGKVLEGFVVRESGDDIELRNAAGIVSVIKTKEIDERGKRTISIMPVELVSKLTPTELAALLAYLESLAK